MAKKIISVAAFMRMISKDYYTNKMPLGYGGDFITSPEISQTFGETIAIWCFEKWQQLGRPPKINLVELGPGRGTLMRDILKTLSHLDFYDAISQIYLVEINHQLKQLQTTNLAQFNIKKISFHDNLDQLNHDPTIIIANEFFDCLAIDQYIYHNDHWHKIMVDLTNKPCFSYVKTNYLKKAAKEGDIIEKSPDSAKLIKKIAKHILKYKGNALIIDYGYLTSNNLTSNNLVSSLQGVKNHQYHSVLEDLGHVDISAHVDFAMLIKAIKSVGIDSFNYFSQREFLLKYEIEARAQKLYQNLPNPKRIYEALGVDRLISNSKMGLLFKVLEF